MGALFSRSEAHSASDSFDESSTDSDNGTFRGSREFLAVASTSVSLATAFMGESIPASLAWMVPFSGPVFGTISVILSLASHVPWGTVWDTVTSWGRRIWSWWTDTLETIATFVTNTFVRNGPSLT